MTGPWSRHANFSEYSVSVPLPSFGHRLDLDHAVGQRDRRLDRVRQALAHVVAHDEPVDHDRDVVLELLVEDDLLLQRPQLAVDLRPLEALGPQLLQRLAVLALAAAHDRREHHEALALRQLHHLVDDLLGRLPLHRLAADVAVRMADARPQQAQVVVDLGDRADRRPRVARGRLLVDRDRRRQALDRVDVGLVHLPQELARVGAQRLDVAALALGVDRVEGERRLARARQPRDDRQRVAREGDVDALEVVLTGAGDDDRVLRRHCRSSVARGTDVRPGVSDAVTAERRKVRDRRGRTLPGALDDGPERRQRGLGAERPVRAALQFRPE